MHRKVWPPWVPFWVVDRPYENLLSPETLEGIFVQAWKEALADEEPSLTMKREICQIHYAKMGRYVRNRTSKPNRLAQEVALYYRYTIECIGERYGRDCGERFSTIFYQGMIYHCVYSPDRLIHKNNLDEFNAALQSSLPKPPPWKQCL